MLTPISGGVETPVPTPLSGAVETPKTPLSGVELPPPQDATVKLEAEPKTPPPVGSKRPRGSPSSPPDCWSDGTKVRPFRLYGNHLTKWNL